MDSQKVEVGVIGLKQAINFSPRQLSNEWSQTDLGKEEGALSYSKPGRNRVENRREKKVVVVGTG